MSFLRAERAIELTHHVSHDAWPCGPRGRSLYSCTRKPVCIRSCHKRVVTRDLPPQVASSGTLDDHRGIPTSQPHFCDVIFEISGVAGGITQIRGVRALVAAAGTSLGKLMGAACHRACDRGFCETSMAYECVVHAEACGLCRR